MSYTKIDTFAVTLRSKLVGFSTVLNEPSLIVPHNEVRKSMARSIGNLIYDVPEDFTGYVSTNLIDEKGYYVPSLAVSEHFYSRLRCGYKILDLFMRKEIGTHDDLVFLLNKYRKVHKVTRKENDVLSDLQNKHPVFKYAPHYEQYKEAGIELVLNPPRRPYWDGKKFSVYGTVYPNAEAAAEAIGITVDKFIDMVRSKRVQYKEVRYYNE